MPTRDDDTVRIGVHPGITNWRFIVSAAGGIAALLGAPASIVFQNLGAGDSSWPLGVASVWVLFAGMLFLGVSLSYGVIEWSPLLHTATLRRHPLSLRRRTVPLDTITEAWRSLASASNGTESTVYRFVSSEGAASRVLVKGTPMKGLDAQGLRALAAFVGELPLEVPDATAPAARDGSRPARASDGIPALTERQRAVAVSRTYGGGKSRVSRDTLLDELDAFIAAAESTDPSGFVRPSGAVRAGRGGIRRPARAKARRRRGGIRGLIALFKADRFDLDSANDDAEALQILVQNPSVAARLRRLLLRVLVGFIAGVLLVVAVKAVLEEVAPRLLNSVADDVFLLLIICAVLLSPLLYLGWCAAADADVRHRRRLARAWMAGRDDDERERGLPEPFVLAWDEQSGRLRMTVASFVCISGAVAVVIAASMVFATTPLPLLTTLGILVSGLAVVALGVLMSVGVVRQRRIDAEEAVYLGGRRLLPRR